MSRQNKVNKDNYTQAGRLTPDDMARERQKQAKREPEQIKGRVGDPRRQPGAERASTPSRSGRQE
jgi:hypothetical protein